MRNLLPKKNKKGITLVETVIAVVVLAILAIGILSLMSAGGRKILLLSKEASDQAVAVQQLDLVIAAVSNGDDRYIQKVTKIVGTDQTTCCYLDIDALKSALSLDDKVQIIAKVALYDGSIVSTVNDDGSLKTEIVSGAATQISYPVNDVRGWYIVLTYKEASAKGVTIEAFVSNSEGVFDK